MRDHPDLLAERIAEQTVGSLVWSCPHRRGNVSGHRILATYPFELDPATGRMRAHASIELKACLDTSRIPYDERQDVRNADEARRQARAVSRRSSGGSTTTGRRIEPKLRTSIVEASVFLSLFDDNPTIKRVFCPPKECYDPIANADGRYGIPLPPFAT